MIAVDRAPQVLSQITPLSLFHKQQEIWNSVEELKCFYINKDWPITTVWGMTTWSYSMNN